MFSSTTSLAQVRIFLRIDFERLFLQNVKSFGTVCNSIPFFLILFSRQNDIIPVLIKADFMAECFVAKFASIRPFADLCPSAVQAVYTSQHFITLNTGEANNINLFRLCSFFLPKFPVFVKFHVSVF